MAFVLIVGGSMRQISPVSRQRSSLVARSPQIEMPNLTTRDLNKLAEMKTAFSAYPNEDRIQSSFEFPVPAVFKAVLEVTYFASCPCIRFRFQT